MSGPARLSLAQQLKQLESDDPSALDPDTAYSSLDGLSVPLRENGEGREHYLDVGPSRLRQENGHILSSEKYAGKRTGRMKIFDDDEDEEDEEDDGGDEEDEQGDAMAGSGSRSGSGIHGNDNDAGEIGIGDGDEDEDVEEDEEDQENGEEDDEDEDESGDAEEEQTVEPVRTSKRMTTSNQPLDPVASLRESRMKDIEKGRGIKRQRASATLSRLPSLTEIHQDLFDALVTLRITFQKALVASSKFPVPVPTDSAGEIDEKKRDALRSLGDLNEKLFVLRESTTIPGAELPVGLGKRKRGEGDEVMDESYWLDSANESLALADTAHPHILPILNKWSTKIQAASVQPGSKQVGGSKFLQSTKTGAGGIVEAIEAGLTSKRDADETFMESEESGYRALLRTVIESRGSGPSIDLTHLPKEKKKKREAERGGSKGRKLRYTVHKKAQDFVVPIPLSHGWHDEQIDELFSSLFGGVGMKGATSEAAPVKVVDGDEGLASLGGMRVF